MTNESRYPSATGWSVCGTWGFHQFGLNIEAYNDKNQYETYCIGIFPRARYATTVNKEINLAQAQAPPPDGQLPAF